MRLWLWGALRASLLALLGGAIGGGALIWLEASGIDLKKKVAAGLEIAQSPEYRVAALLSLAAVFVLLLFGAIYSVRRVSERRNRPPLTTVKALRGALVSVTEDVFDVFPDDVLASAALAKLRTLVFELDPYAGFSKSLAAILDLGDSYVAHAVRGPSRDDATEASDAASIHDEALREIRRLLETTNWAGKLEDR